MSAMGNLLIDHKPSWQGVGSISITPVFDKLQSPWHIEGYKVSINGEFNDKVYPFQEAHDAVNYAIMEWSGDWPVETEQ